MNDAVADGDGRFVCPECGKVAKNERALLRTRRRWRWLVAPIVLWLFGYAAWTTPRAYEHGWPGAAPTTVMVAGLPMLSDADVRSQPGAGYARPPVQATGIARLSEELLRRSQENEHWKWQWRALMHAARWTARDRLAPRRGTGSRTSYYQALIARARQHDQLKDADHLALDQHAELVIWTAKEWPAEQPLYASVVPWYWSSEGGSWEALDPESHVRSGERWSPNSSSANQMWFPWSDHLHAIAIPDPETGTYEIDIAMYVERHGSSLAPLAREYRHTGRVQIRGLIEDYKSPVKSSELGELLQTCIAFQAYAESDGELLSTMMYFRDGVTTEQYGRLLDLCNVAGGPTIGGRLELLDPSGAVRANGFWWWTATVWDRQSFETSGRLSPISTHRIKLERVQDRDAAGMTTERMRVGWKLRIVPDATILLRDMDNPLYLDEVLTLTPYRSADEAEGR